MFRVCPVTVVDVMFAKVNRDSRVKKMSNKIDRYSSSCKLEYYYRCVCSFPFSVYVINLGIILATITLKLGARSARWQVQRFSYEMDYRSII